MHWRAHSLPFGGSRLKACRQCLIKSSLGLLQAVAMRKCNFLRGLPLVNLQAATLINTIQTNVSQHSHANINHSDISFLTSVSPLARSQTLHEMEGRRRRGGGKRRRGETIGGEREALVYQKQENHGALQRGLWIEARQWGDSAPSRKSSEENKQIKENDDALCNRREINQIRECRA